MEWFTADTHFNHTNIIRYCNRPFKNIGEMDDILVSNWNSVVEEDDIVYHLGDFSFGDPRKYFGILKGHILIVPGSHDKEIKKLPKENILPPIALVLGGITLCHYAMRSWDRSHYGTWHLFGHHHGKLEHYGLSFDVGVDCWNYYPVSLEEVGKKMGTLKPIVDYSKKSLSFSV